MKRGEELRSVSALTVTANRLPFVLKGSKADEVTEKKCLFRLTVLILRWKTTLGREADVKMLAPLVGSPCRSSVA